MIYLSNLTASPDDDRDFPYVPGPFPESAEFATGDIEDQLAIGSCHDDKTEVLTRSGWRLFSSLNGDEQLATVNTSTLELLYESPVRLVRLNYDGKLICAENSSLNFCVTPDHKMVVRKWDESKRALSDNYSFVEAKNIGWYAGLINRVIWDGSVTSDVYTLPGVPHKHIPQRSNRNIPMALWLKFLGIYLAEGTMLKRDQRKCRISYKIQIAAGPDEEHNFIRSLMVGMGITALELKDRFTFSNRQIYEAMSALGLEGVKAGFKFVPRFVFEQPAYLITEFIEGFFQGDGSESDGQRSLYTGSRTLAEDLQELIFLSGNESRISVRAARTSVMKDGRVVLGNLDEHRVSICERRNQSIDRKEVIFEKSYSGEVFCAEVPTHHTLVTRRNGKILVSGNCTANAVVSACESIKPGHLSRLFNYYHTRALENRIGQSGAALRDAVKVATKLGLPSESLWPYDESKADVQPPAEVLDEANKHKVLQYQRIDLTGDWLTRANNIKSALSQGFPVVFAMPVTTQFAQLTKSTSKGYAGKAYPWWPVIGNHAMVFYGYDRDFLHAENSWGTAWGDVGRWSLRIGLVEEIFEAWAIIGFDNVVPDIPRSENYLKVARLYRACLSRKPDADGIAWWVKQIDAGMELRDMAARFMDSAEFMVKYGDVSDAEFIQLLYINVLGRAPDAEGYAYWLGQIVFGYPKQDILVSFSESAENKAA